MSENKQKSETARNLPDCQDRAVLRTREEFWKEVAQFSVIAFFLISGIAIIGHYYLSGTGVMGPRAWLSGGRSTQLENSTENTSGILDVVDSTLPIRAVDGEPLPEGVKDGPYYYAVVIDNHVDARPLSGLSEASLVYEVPVEGGITRLMAVYSNGNLIKRIGPVRSARPYFVDWAAELDPLYVHIGGSPEALARIKATDDVFDLNEFWNGKYFWRDMSRFAPHNVYTSTGLMGNALYDKYGDSEFRPIESWSFKSDVRLEDRPLEVDDLIINWSSPAYLVSWNYNSEKNSYRRFQGGAYQKDEDNASIYSKNVIVEFHNVRVIDNVGRRSINTIGQGRAVVFSDGVQTEATWNKPSVKARTQYLTPDGDEVFLNVGPTWIEVVPESIEISGIN